VTAVLHPLAIEEVTKSGNFMTSSIIESAREAPLPVGAAFGAPWEPDESMASRPFFGVPRAISGSTIVVGTVGHQWSDGSIEPVAGIEVIGLLRCLNSDQARELGLALLEAADEVDGWAQQGA
jgi:hypothetical protein